jgi:serine protease Do
MNMMENNQSRGLTPRPRHVAAISLVMSGAAIIGGLLWAANPQATPLHKSEPTVPQVPVIEQPIARNRSITTSFAPIVKQVSPSVVRVTTVVKAKTVSNRSMSPGQPSPDTDELPPFLRRFFGDEFQGNMPRQWRMPPQRGEGSGVIVSQDGYILTNNHVVDGADEVKVHLIDNREFVAKVVGKDPKSDVAVIKVTATDLPAIKIADSEQVEVGDLVLAIGNPFGIGQTVTMGVVSAKGRHNVGIEDYEDFIQTDAPINPGNSGGALVDVEGRLVGINTAILSRSGGNQGIGFAVPANLAREVMVSLVKYGHMVRGYLGVTIQDVNPALAREFKLKDQKGALVADVAPDGPAHGAGIQSGDVVLEYNGKTVADSHQLRMQVAQTKPGESLPLKVLRQGKLQTIQLKVGEMPGEDRVIKASNDSTDDNGTLNGVGVTDLTPQARKQNNISDKIQGALVTQVDPDSASAAAGLKPGDVIVEINHQKVKSADDAVRLTENPKDKETLLRVWSQGGTHYVVVDERNTPGA